MLNNLKKISLFLISCFIYISSYSNRLYVCISGCGFKSVTTAVNSAAPYDSVILKGGVHYVETIIITKPVTIIGENGAEVDGAGNGSIFIIRADDVIMKGLKLCNTGRSGIEDMAGIRIEKSDNITVEKNIFDNCYFGVFLANSHYAKIKGNFFCGSEKGPIETGNGIHCWQADSILVEDNYLTNHRDGIYFEFVTHSKIANNISKGNSRYGLHFMFSDNDSYYSNVFANNGAGVAVMYSKFIKMQYNLFSDNWGSSSYGLLLKDIADCNILENNFTNNTAGAYIEGSNRVYFKENIFEGNGWAVRLLANCVSDSFERNVFIGNTFDFSSNGTMSNNNLLNNYWDKYAGYDLDKNGVGDVPYRPVSAYSVVVENVPLAMVFMRSLMVNMMDQTERVLPSLIPENIIDGQPLMKQPL